MQSKHVKTSGPLFDGRAKRALNDFIREFAEGYAHDVNDELQSRFTKKFKNPTGRYQAHVRARRVGVGRSVVNGGDLPYGPWLEGGTRRNQRSTFKGYHSFGLTARKMRRRAKVDANAEFKRRYLRRMNG
jgi:hypothetical protein